MRLPNHWDFSPAEAIALQKELARSVVRADRLGAVRHVCGIDVDFGNGIARAAAAVLSFPGLELREYAIARKASSFPYIPGLLSFRETPLALAALGRLAIAPDRSGSRRRASLASIPRRLGAAAPGCRWLTAANASARCCARARR